MSTGLMVINNVDLDMILCGNTLLIISYLYINGIVKHSTTIGSR